MRGFPGLPRREQGLVKRVVSIPAVLIHIPGEPAALGSRQCYHRSFSEEPGLGFLSINLECSTFAPVPSYSCWLSGPLLEMLLGGPLLYLLRASVSNARVKSFPSMFTYTWV